MTDHWQSFLSRYRDDPAGFSEHVVGMKPLDWQREVMDAIASGERLCSIRSGHGVGKSSCAAVLILWFILTRYPCKVVVTAPTAQTTAGKCYLWVVVDDATGNPEVATARLHWADKRGGGQ